MTHVYNAERGFKDEFLDGLSAAYGRYLRPIPGASGVMSVSAPTQGRASVLIGGGSGHYPAFAGLVGPGLCDGAVVGDLFTSPSAEQAYRCIRAVDGSAGVLLSFGNYSGDVMNFGLAAERARAEGIDVRIVLVTDDVASAPAERGMDRRGIAGGFFVFRAAASAAHAGLGIDDVERIARHVNQATRTFGVAFGGCTFPGRPEPLFTVETGRIELGLGIHGERGIAMIDWVPADELAATIVERLLAERPTGAIRARPLLNGLGATKYEELFVLYRSIARRLVAQGIELVSPEVGEFVTSLDMAGCSLTLCWLDDEVERWLGSPASAPGYRTDGVLSEPAALSGGRSVDPAAGVDLAKTAAMPPRRQTRAARTAVASFAAMSDAMAAIEGDLGRLDAVAGDGDHGAGMTRGMFAAATAAATAGPRAADVIRAAALAFSDAAGGASGALWGAGLLAMSGAIRRTSTMGPGEAERAPDAVAIHHGLVAALDAVMRLGGARPGDKTMVDALAPFVVAFGVSDASSVAQRWSTAVAAARQGAAATADFAATKGRAAVHGDRSRGSQDPGAVSLAAAVDAASDAIKRSCTGEGARKERP